MIARVMLFALLVATPLALAKEMQVDVFLHEYSGGLHIVPEQVNVDVGDVVTFTVKNEGQSPHNLLVCGDAIGPSNDCADAWGRIGMIPPAETRPLQFTAAKAGTFEYWCYVPGHKGAGMKGTLVVAGESTSEEKDVPGVGLAALLGVAAALAIGRRRA